MRSFVAALQFLTVFPGVGRVSCTESTIGRSSVWFPAVGLLIGACAVASDAVALHFFGKTVADVWAIVFLCAASGGLHADGLADTGDGFFSSRGKERILEIMRDSRIGTMGALFLLAVFSMKFAAFSSLPEFLRPQTLLLMPLAGRCAMLFQLSVLNYARADGGLCSAFVRYAPPALPWVATLWLASFGWVSLSWLGLQIAATTVLATAIFSIWCIKKIGGFTGDTLGACCEGAEVIPALTALAWCKTMV